MALRDAINALAAFLARQDAPPSPANPCDALVVCGSAVLASARVAVDALAFGATARVLLSGGVGHSTALLADAIRAAHGATIDTAPSRSESAMLADVCVALGARAEDLLLESASTNCGANATCSRSVLEAAGGGKRLMLVQDPTMQLRTHASFQRAYEGVGGVELVSAAPFVPRVEEGDGGASPSLLGSVGLVLLPAGVWTDERFLTLLLGEVPRLVDGPGGYGPRGSNFIPHVDVPPAILAAHEVVRSAFPHLGTARAPVPCAE